MEKMSNFIFNRFLMSIRTQLQFISIENTVFHQLMFNVLVSKILANQKTDTEIEFHNFDFTIWVL